MLSFSGGEILHSGDQTISGVRYIIAAFCYADKTIGGGESDTSSSMPKQSKLQNVFAIMVARLRYLIKRRAPVILLWLSCLICCCFAQHTRCEQKTGEL